MERGIGLVTSVSDLVGPLREMPRPDVDRYFLLMATLVASRGTCGRRRVGCVLVDKQNHVIATGYNGPASGLPHCIDTPCEGRHLPSGTGLDKCQALHAEENALIQCTRPQDIYTVYCTASPCEKCVQRLMNTPARHLVFAEVYPHSNSRELWIGSETPERLSRKWTHLALR